MSLFGPCSDCYSRTALQQYAQDLKDKAKYPLQAALKEADPLKFDPLHPDKGGKSTQVVNGLEQTDGVASNRLLDIKV